MRNNILKICGIVCAGIVVVLLLVLFLKMPLSSGASHRSLWNSLDGTTWQHDNGWAGDGYVFYSNSAGELRCLHQEYGSGVYVTHSELLPIEILSDSSLKIGTTVFSLKHGQLISGETILTLYKHEILVYDKNGVVDPQVVRTEYP